MAWYPGSERRAAAFRAAVPGVEELGVAVPASEAAGGAQPPPASYIPWLFRAGLSPEEVRSLPATKPARHCQFT